MKLIPWCHGLFTAIGWCVVFGKNLIHDWWSFIYRILFIFRIISGFQFLPGFHQLFRNGVLVRQVLAVALFDLEQAPLPKVGVTFGLTFASLERTWKCNKPLAPTLFLKGAFMNVVLCCVHNLGSGATLAIINIQLYWNIKISNFICWNYVLIDTKSVY